MSISPYHSRVWRTLVDGSRACRLGLLLLGLPVIWVTARFVALFMSILRFGTVRAGWGAVYTPVIRLKHDTGRRVTLVGMIHIGDAEYYTSIRALLDKEEAAASRVLCEGIGKLSPLEEEAMSAEERGIADQIHRHFSIIEALAERMGLCRQQCKLGDSPSWIHRDVSQAVLVKRLYLAGGSFPAIDDHNWVQCVPEKVLKFVFGACLAVMPILPGLDDRGMRRVIHLDRDTVAAMSVVDQAVETDVVATWGASHLPGIVKILKGYGFRVESRYWLKARPITVWRDGRTAVKTLWNS